MTRYLIRHDFTLALLAWSHDLPRAMACAHALRSRSIPCFIEVTR
jgi:hypothetical protein